jgi:predicted Ser/Thr protein kinase
LTVGGYELLTRIGEGGMGVVHLARQPGGERVALKVIRPHIVGDDEARDRLAREVNSLKRIRSRRVAEIIDADPYGDIPFVATRYVPGLSLAEHVAQEGPILGADLTWFAWCLAEALSDVHACGVLHRDIKPSNVLMEGRSPVLIDFGLARVADDPRLTHTGWLLGTPGYLAPEILEGRDSSTASDVHSWAATVAYAGLGRSPYGSGPSAAIMDRVRIGQHDLAGLPQGIGDLVLAALAPDPAVRPTLPYLLSWLRRQVGSTPAEDSGPALAEESPPVAAIPAPEPPPMLTMPLSVVAPADVRPLVAPPSPHAVTGRLDTHGAPVPATQVLVAPDDPTSPEASTLAPPTPAPLGERLRRGTTLLLAALLVGVGVAAYPYLALLGVVVAVWILRAMSQTASGHQDRRRIRGTKWYDGPQSVLTAPWHLLSTLPMTLMLVLWAVLMELAVGLLAFALNLDAISTLVLGGVALAVSVWLGPGGSRVRGPLGAVVRAGSRNTGPWAVVCLALIFAVGAGVAWLRSQGIDWTPYSGGPLARVPQWPDWLRAR